ncbi:MAG: hypothetical protein RLZZ215_934 [Pseudomonadota bacterium]|jgi:transposase-like protein
MATIAVKCRYCESEVVYKHGHARSGEPRYRCRNCQRSFQAAYHYEDNKAATPEKIVEMAMNGSGVRDTSRVLGVSITTVIAHLKKTKTRRRQPLIDSSTR